MNVDYHPEAREEFLQAVAYSEKEFGTGEKLRLSVSEAHGLLKQFPTIGEPEEHAIRRFSLADFPYSVVYFHDEEAQEILILAFMHNAREPGYWKERL